ncbi:FAD-dependent oxidoreductase [Comamonas piscis]|uniref:FAD-dependent oxidoreductase n=1 Tax=Comamonas piscis TaxID=1562974 RepID=A0A7G5ELB9_9BURK|nr:FAD-dependent oxidoreductase [Comamonas piscis]QMV74794.1 FAD-dependent oxidoreductase [Comamonas piscis]WSO33264.1 FAD-dependent oxidoreductase [Comamonas piscis]
MTETANKRGPQVQAPKQVVVVGAGVVGVATALALQSYGVSVTLIDRGEPGMECSYGNSGAISPGSVAPLALPGVLKTVPGMLMDQDGPLSIGWKHLPKAASWLVAFAQSADPKRVAAAAERLNDLYQGAVDAHAALAQSLGVSDLFMRRGHLHLYPDADYAQQDATGWQLRAKYGYQVEELDRAGIEALEPHAPQGYAHGRYLADHGTILNPLRYVQSMLHAFVQRGGKLVRAEVKAIRPDDKGWAVRTGDATLDAQRWPHVVVAAGAWASSLLKPLGMLLPIETQRGYHAQFAGAQHLVERTVVLADKKVFIAPMEGGLRVGGTVEIAGLKAPPNPRRAAGIERIAREAFPALAGLEAQHWMGHRPCLPGSVPIVGHIDAIQGLWLAVGHGHLGLTGSLPTAQRIANGMCGPQPLPFWQLRTAG